MTDTANEDIVLFLVKTRRKSFFYSPFTIGFSFPSTAQMKTMAVILIDHLRL